MRILQVNKHYYPWIGGIETVVQDIAEGLKGHEMDVLVCSSDPKQQSAEEKINGVNVYRAKTLGKIKSMPVSFDFFRLFRKLSKEADIIILHHPFPLSFLAAFLFAKNKKIIVFYHSDIIRQKFLNILVEPLIKSILGRSQRVFVLGRNIVEYSKLLKPFQSKCLVIPYGVDLKKFENVDQSFIQSIKDKYKSKKIILSVGRLVYYKGYEFLIEAMKGIDAQLLIIGEGPLKQKLQRQIKENNLESSIEIISNVKDLVPYIYASEFFLLPSVERSEAFGIVQLEAMACSKAVINTNLKSAVPEVSVNGITGITVEPGDTQSLHNAIDKLLTDSQLLEKYNLAAKDRVRNFYSKEEFLENIEFGLSGKDRTIILRT